jgi:hypothetical protein
MRLPQEKAGVYSECSQVMWQKLFFLVMKIAEIKFNHWILNNNLLVFMVFNATFNNISVVSWQSVLLPSWS